MTPPDYHRAITVLDVIEPLVSAYTALYGNCTAYVRGIVRDINGDLCFGTVTPLEVVNFGKRFVALKVDGVKVKALFSDPENQTTPDQPFTLIIKAVTPTN